MKFVSGSKRVLLTWNKRCQSKCQNLSKFFVCLSFFQQLHSEDVSSFSFDSIVNTIFLTLWWRLFWILQPLTTTVIFKLRHLGPFSICTVIDALQTSIFLQVFTCQAYCWIPFTTLNQFLYLKLENVTSNNAPKLMSISTQLQIFHCIWNNIYISELKIYGYHI